MSHETLRDHRGLVNASSGEGGKFGKRRNDLGNRVTLSETFKKAVRTKQIVFRADMNKARMPASEANSLAATRSSTSALVSRSLKALRAAMPW